MGSLTGLIQQMSGRRYQYYVDSVNGNDLNSGRLPSEALKTIGALPAITAGMRIGLARNSAWKEQLTIAAERVTVGAYGTGTRPILDCSDAILAGAWSKTGGLTNVYEASVSPDLAASKTWVSVWEDNARLVRATSTANCDATPGSYYPSADTGAAPITLYVHASDSSDPGASGKVYEFSSRRYGLVSTADRVSVTGIETRRNLHDDGSLVVKRYARITDVVCRDGTKHNLLYGGESILTGVIAQEAYYTGGPSSSMFVLNQNDANNENCTLVDRTSVV